VVAAPRTRTVLLATAAGTLVLAAVACGVRSDRARAEPQTAGSSVTHLEVDGADRSYRIYRPAELPASPALVVMLHGGLGSGSQAEVSYGWDDVADREGFVVAYPEGVGRTWNTEGGCCGRAAARSVDDVAFITALVSDVTHRLEVDPDRVYATGMSNGAMMSYTLACRTDVFAAIAPVAGTMLADCASPDPVSVLHIHGTADTHILFGGGRGTGPAQVEGPPIADVIDRWRQIDDCADASVTTVGPVERSESSCASGRAVELVTIDGAGHQWPASIAPRASADPPSRALDATQAIWDFFASHPKPKA
jgi:polyhydroxybutyrate depolymerase